MEKATSAQIKRLYTLLRKAALLEDKCELVLYASNGRTKSSKELTTKEIRALIDQLVEIDPNKAMLKKVYAIAYDLGIIVQGDADERKINNAALDAWLIRNSYLAKPLHKYSTRELPKLISQLESVRCRVTTSQLNNEAKTSVDALLLELNLTTAR